MVQWVRTSAANAGTRVQSPGPVKIPHIPRSNEARSSPLKSCHHLLSRHQRAQHSFTFSHHRGEHRGSRLPRTLGPRQRECRASPLGATLQLQVPARPLSSFAHPRALLQRPHPSEPSWAEHPDQPSLGFGLPEERPEGSFTCQGCYRNTTRMAAPLNPAQCWIALHRSAFPSSASGAPHLTNTPSLHTHADLCSGCRVPRG